MPILGEKVTLQGVGRRWQSFNYEAVVVDVRESDGTVKVKYADGGYKRFPLSQFNSLVIEDVHPYKFENYELLDETYDPTVEAIDHLSELRAKIDAAKQKLDLAEAKKLKASLDDIVLATEEWQEAKDKLIYSLRHDDFDEAERNKARVESLHKKLVGLGGSSPESVDSKTVFQKALQRALGGGVAGAIAMVIQVTTLMWMRTTMNYQYRYGTSTKEALSALYKEGGILRFYRGYLPGLLQGPLSRFGDTAANTGVLAFLNANPSTQSMPTGIKTVFASVGAASFRIFLMPIDTLKTTLQVEGATGMQKLTAKFKKGGPSVFYHGSLAASAATFAGHYPWFATYNTLSGLIPEPDTTAKKLGRNAFMGFCSSFVSDCTSNSIRVVKTYRQTHTEMISYPQAVKDILAQDGVAGLFGRGLGTRLIANGFQGVMFSVMWKLFEPKVNALFDKKNEK
mmetsp:Transcript_22042/g.43805  ORF Transcript_22042/g.43805 Transcript_22042/m.43805 type:complete len:454 (-) Transcript_22042:368-1729(-)|eukprot:CAMPEP_0175144662 /NCGR_PEP_ID=MMETSP0087-20121206/14276_1 /TAXON_ID=136419 /ORGANISM="Unknown Unknown, Strain D1" /LENGTH=453 /DNA_ID=CAMNT_0016429195 /DNA_START=48 /DNA_END=1409 /DNA_ORIENTATION=+